MVLTSIVIVSNICYKRADIPKSDKILAPEQQAPATVTPNLL